MPYSLISLYCARNLFARNQNCFAFCFTRSFRYTAPATYSLEIKIASHFALLAHFVIIYIMKKRFASLLLLLLLGAQTAPVFAFSLFKSKESKSSESVPSTGYKGTLPNIDRYFEYKKEGTQSAPEKIKEGTPGSAELMKAPLNDDLFLDVIIKKEGPSPYLKDMLSILDLLEKIYYTLLEENFNVQKYNAQVNLLDLNVSTLLKTYSSSSYSASPAYTWAQRASYCAKTFGNLIYDANYYSRYVPITDGQYSVKNIQKEKEKLIGELDKAAFAIRQLE